VAAQTTTEQTASLPETTAAPRGRVRADIQGLRAVAVVAVILNHLLGWPSGGFVGVDVFFVISGFLITGLILRERERTGRFSIVGFYARRIRRILPAALTVLIATTAVGWFVFNKTRAWETIWDAVASFFLAANWRFAVTGTDYFQQTDADSPLQHFWSLSVEEQFYLVWPALLLLLFAIGMALSRGNRDRSGRRIRIVVISVMGLISVASFAFAVWETRENAEIAYFSTFTRVWELGVGAVLAAAAPLFLRLPVAVRFVLGWAGLAGIVASFFVIDASKPFPGPWAALPIVATAVVLLAGIGGPQRYLFPISNPVTTFLGNISYSLYLWHFPVIVFVPLFLVDETLERTLITAGLIFVISVLAYLLIEQPLHHSPWLRSFSDAAVTDAEARRVARAAARSEAWARWQERFGSQFILSTLALLVVVTVVIIAAGFSSRGQAPQAAPEASQQNAANPLDQARADLSAALSATAWPDNLSPSLDDALRTTSNDNPARGCFEPGSTPDFGGCTWGSGDAPNHMYVVGDSIALTYAPAFRQIADNSDGQWKITTIGLYGCRFTDVLVQNDGDGVMDSCTQRKQDIADRIASDQPQLVVVANAFALGQSSDGRPLSTTDMVSSTASLASRFNSAGKIVYLAPPPLGADLDACYSQVSNPGDCVVDIDPAWQDFSAATQAQAQASGDHYIDALPVNCVDGRCPAFAATWPTKYDTVHLTTAYSEHIAPAIRRLFADQGLM
jgi:peptidoglycan/LPS O-acetylase OafA/YrhL